MERIEITEGVELVQPETTVDPERLAEVRKLVVSVGRKMFQDQEREKRTLPGPEFYEPLK